MRRGHAHAEQASRRAAFSISHSSTSITGKKRSLQIWVSGDGAGGLAPTEGSPAGGQDSQFLTHLPVRTHRSKYGQAVMVRGGASSHGGRPRGRAGFSISHTLYTGKNPSLQIWDAGGSGGALAPTGGGPAGGQDSQFLTHLPVRTHRSKYGQAVMVRGGASSHGGRPRGRAGFSISHTLYTGKNPSLQIWDAGGSGGALAPTGGGPAGGQDSQFLTHLPV